MRQLEPSIYTLFDALQPQHLHLFAEAVKNISKYQTDINTFKSPTFAMNIATSLKQCCDIAINFVLKKQGQYVKVVTAEAESN